jgi:hypothetical protein
VIFLPSPKELVCEQSLAGIPRNTQRYPKMSFLKLKRKGREKRREEGREAKLKRAPLSLPPQPATNSISRFSLFLFHASLQTNPFPSDLPDPLRRTTVT